MKKIILLVALFPCFLSYGQDFPVVWKTKFSFNPDKWHFSDDGKYALGRDESQAEMLDGATGKVLWKLNFKNDLQVKTLSRAHPNFEEGVILFFNKDEKKKNGEKVVIDCASGKQLWRADSYAGIDGGDNFHFAHCVGLAVRGITIVFDNETKKLTGLDMRSGAKRWESKNYADVDIKSVHISAIPKTDFAYVYISDEDSKNFLIEYYNIVTGETTDGSAFSVSDGDYNEEFRIDMYRSAGKSKVHLLGSVKSLFSTKMIFTLSGSGDVKWAKQFEGSTVFQAFNNLPYVQLEVQGDKIFVLSKDITVFDLKTGTQLWTAPYDNCDSGGFGKNKQEFGIAGWPLVSGDYVYYVDLEVDNTIKKAEILTGKVVWQSEKIKSNDRVPNLIIANGVLLAQFGGMINAQMAVYLNGGGYRKTNENKFDGDYGVRAYDLATGLLIWNTSNLTAKLGDKFSDRITTIYTMGAKILVASDKNVFCLDAKTGDIVYKTAISSSKIGDVFELTVSEDAKTLQVFCDNGVALLEIASGKLIYATKTDEIRWKLPGTSTYSFHAGENFFLYVGKNDYIGFDLANGKVKGMKQDSSNPQLTQDGNYIFYRHDETLTKYAVNKP